MKTKPDEFVKFHKCLMSNAPKNYIPWYFPVVKHNKAPDGLAISKRCPSNVKGKKGNWKAKWSRLTFDEALERLKNDKNVGLAAMSFDPLIIIDIDEFELINTMPNTLTCISRKRCGQHGFCWKIENEKKRNIPTEYGEIRSSDQYVVCAGSYCTTSHKEIDKENITDNHKNNIKEDYMLGVYTVFRQISPIKISFSDLPFFFKEHEKTIKEKPIIQSKSINMGKNHSALFDLRIEDIVSCNRNARVPHPLHSSDTGMNFSVENGLAHCWRHNVSLNAIQFLVVKSGYMSCGSAGTGHKNSGAGSSDIINDDGAIFHAWLEAKKCNLIKKNDPVPIKALHYIAKKNKLIEKLDGYTLPKKVYNKVLMVIEAEY